MPESTCINILICLWHIFALPCAGVTGSALCFRKIALTPGCNVEHGEDEVEAEKPRRGWESSGNSDAVAWARPRGSHTNPPLITPEDLMGTQARAYAYVSTWSMCSGMCAAGAKERCGTDVSEGLEDWIVNYEETWWEGQDSGGESMREVWSSRPDAHLGSLLVPLTCYELFPRDPRSLPFPVSNFYRWGLCLFLDLIHPWSSSPLQRWATSL